MKRNTLFLAGLLLAACSHAPKTGVDTIFVNAFAWTLEESAPVAEAIAVSGNEIVYVGDNDGALALAELERQPAPS